MVRFGLILAAGRGDKEVHNQINSGMNCSIIYTRHHLVVVPGGGPCGVIKLCISQGTVAALTLCPSSQLSVLFNCPPQSSPQSRFDPNPTHLQLMCHCFGLQVIHSNRIISGCDHHHQAIRAHGDVGGPAHTAWRDLQGVCAWDSRRARVSSVR